MREGHAGLNGDRNSMSRFHLTVCGCYIDLNACCRGMPGVVEDNCSQMPSAAVIIPVDNEMFSLLGNLQLRNVSWKTGPLNAGVCFENLRMLSLGP